METIHSSSYVIIFLSGTVAGAITAYIVSKFWKNSVERGHEDDGESGFEFNDPHKNYRLILGIRNDLKMQKGKVAAQCAHAAVEAYAKALNRCPKTLKRWSRYGAAKIAVRVDSEQELLELDKKAKEMKLLSSIIIDDGLTQVASGTRTVIAIGPGPKSVIDKVTGHLKLY